MSGITGGSLDDVAPVPEDRAPAAGTRTTTPTHPEGDARTGPDRGEQFGRYPPRPCNVDSRAVAARDHALDLEVDEDSPVAPAPPEPPDATMAGHWPQFLAPRPHRRVDRARCHAGREIQEFDARDQ